MDAEPRSWTRPLRAAIVLSTLMLAVDVLMVRVALGPGRTVDGSTVLLLLLLAPFNLMALSLWHATRFWRRLARDPRGGARISVRGPITRVRPPQHGPVAAALATVSAGALLAAVALALFAGRHPPRALSLAAAALVAMVGLAELLRAAAFLRSGAADLVIDRDAQTVTLPRPKIGDAAHLIPSAQIGAVVVEDPRPRQDRRGRRAPAGSYPVVILRSDIPTARQLIAEWPDRASANRFRQWLETELRNPAQRP